MNPFDLRGPDFLLFYLVFAAAVTGAAFLLRRMRESGRAPKLKMDPYLISYLRGGEAEAARVAIVSLVDRGLLLVDGTRLERAPHAHPGAVRHRIEKLLLEEFDAARPATEAFQFSELPSACSEYRSTLEAHALLPDAPIKATRALLVAGALFLLVAVAMIKIAVAMQRGRSNVAFLFLLMFLAIFPVVAVCCPRLTVLGHTMLADLRALYAGLRSRAAAIVPGGGTIEAVMLAAIFGVTALPAAGFGYARTLFPKATKDDGSSTTGGTSCGSSCGSSGGDGGGGSGGGCGGGCGGCGS
jgi:uncharacterized protein (TIGR04222 family)